MLLRFLDDFQDRPCKHSPSTIKKCAWSTGFLMVLAESSKFARTSDTFRPPRFPSLSATLADAQNSPRCTGFRTISAKSSILARTSDMFRLARVPFPSAFLMRNSGVPQMQLKPIEYQHFRLFYLLWCGGIVKITQVLQYFCDSLIVSQIALGGTPLQLSRNALGLMTF